jgi:hypothetical protein
LLRRYLLGDVVVELKFPYFPDGFGGKLDASLFLLFIFNLLVRGSPHHYVSVWLFGFI